MIYFDNAATVLPSDEVLSLHAKYEKEYFANSRTIYKIGLDANHALDKARESILNILNIKDYDVIFTSGATEAINLALKGVAFKYKNRGKHIITSNIEHPAVLESLKQLHDEFGYEITYLSVNDHGVISIDELKAAMRNDTIIVAIMAVNNEVGSINDIKAIYEVTKNYPKCFLFSDLTQAIGKTKLPFSNLDMFAMSSHKLGGLKGSGLLVKKKKINILPLNSGGLQESGFRSGTVNVANNLITLHVLESAIKNIDNHYKKVKEIHDYLFNELSKIEGIHMNSYIDALPYVINFSTLNHRASVIVEALSNKEIYVSSTSACHSSFDHPSHVTLAMYHDNNVANNSIRISFSSTSNIEEAKIFIKEFKEVISCIK